MSWNHDASSALATDRRVAVEKFIPSAAGYGWDSERGAFRHQYDRDLQLFVIWEKARPHEDRILEMIEQEFRVLARFEVHWSAERMVNDFERLYATGVGLGSGKEEDAGTGPFLLVVIEDPDPVYQYRQNVSGFVELTNIRMARVKRAARQLAGGYTVHSSNGLDEFFRDATLILGPRRLDEVLARSGEADPDAVEHLADDLVGAEGWADLDELVAVLRRSSEYLVMRSFADLPEVLGTDPEIDVLARSRDDFAAIVGAAGAPSESAATALVGGVPVVFDIREVGDGYFDRRWQERMLQRRVIARDAVARPRIDDHFFSLLYHVKIQKLQIKPSHAALLPRLAAQLDLPAELRARITDDDVAESLLDGYLSAHGYGVPQPVDREVERNEAFTARLRMTTVEPSVEEVVRAWVWSRMRHSRVGSRAAQSDGLRAVVRRLRGLRRTRTGVGR